MALQIRMKALRASDRRADLARLGQRALAALPLRPRRKATPFERLTRLIARRQSPAPVRWWSARTHAQRVGLVAVAASGSVMLVGASTWTSARLLARRASGRALGPAQECAVEPTLEAESAAEPVAEPAASR
jgi:hypothetical protein